MNESAAYQPRACRGAMPPQMKIFMALPPNRIIILEMNINKNALAPPNLLYRQVLPPRAFPPVTCLLLTGTFFGLFLCQASRRERAWHPKTAPPFSIFLSSFATVSFISGSAPELIIISIVKNSEVLCIE